jgi:hypothetical protein
MNVKVDVGADVTYTDATKDGYVRFERGPESMFRRIQIFDASGNLLENFENYNDMYCSDRTSDQQPFQQTWGVHVPWRRLL